jgi:hypothetical protein
VVLRVNRAGTPAIEDIWETTTEPGRHYIGRASAGCLVGRTKAGRRAFMALCKADPRYRANDSYRFLTSVLPAASVATA